MVLANQDADLVDYSAGHGRTQMSTRSDNQEAKSWIAEIGRDGSNLLPEERIISDFLGPKRFIIQFTTAAGETITDEYLPGAYRSNR
jgi:hypothetical protein